MTTSSGPGANDWRSSITRSTSGPSCWQTTARTDRHCRRRGVAPPLLRGAAALATQAVAVGGHPVVGAAGQRADERGTQGRPAQPPSAACLSEGGGHRRLTAVERTVVVDPIG